MPKDREKKTLNPATAHLKSEKARALKKGKAAVQAQRTDRLASRNPFRLERQIADLQALAGDGGGLAARDKKVLEELERQLGMVRRAREKVGDTRVPSTTAGREEGGVRCGGAERGRGGGGRGGGGYKGLGKRMRGGEREISSGDGGSETDESVRAIPMPRDTPPPMPHSHPHRGRGGHHRNPSITTTTGNANMEPLGERAGRPQPQPPPPSTSTSATSAMAPKTTYTAAPAIRNLRKEAVTAFMPAVVARKVAAASSRSFGRLLEEEEVERLEGEGYLRGPSRGGGVARRESGGNGGDGDGDGDGGVGQGDGAGKGGLEEEEERFRREMEMELEGEGEGEGRGGRKVGIEELRDEDL